MICCKTIIYEGHDEGVRMIYLDDNMMQTTRSHCDIFIPSRHPQCALKKVVSDVCPGEPNLLMCMQ